MNVKKMTCITLICIILTILLTTAAPAQTLSSDLFDSSFEAETSGDYARALNMTLEIVRADASNYTAILRAGWLCYLNENYKSSITYYQNAHTLKPKSIEPLLGMSLPLMADKQWEIAERIIRDVISKDPENYLANSRLAFILYSMGDYGSAKSYYLHVLQLYPGDIDMKLGLAWTYVKMGHKTKAAAWFKDVLTVRKTNVSALAGMDTVRNM